MASVLPNIKPGKTLQIQFKKPNQKCTINSLTNTLKKLIPNIKEIKITPKKGPTEVNNKLYSDLSVKKGQKIQIQDKPVSKEKLDNFPVQYGEYYPNKVKRTVDLKKIVLEPKHDYKVVAATNKRKRSTPVKDAGSLKKLKPDTPSPEITSNELSFEDIIPSSIIHKIKDTKTTSPVKLPMSIIPLDPKIKLRTGSDLKNSPITRSDLKNNPMPSSDQKTGPMPSSDLKTGPMPSSKVKTMPPLLPLKRNQRLQSALKSDTRLQKTDANGNLSTSSVSKPKSGSLQEMGFMNDESLTDEDFMEILTCPSPVWWEDPPDESFLEEPIGHFLNQDHLPQTQDCKKVPSESTQRKEVTQNDPTEYTKVFTATKTFGNKKLIEKRLNLENLLSTLKNNSVNVKKISENGRKISSDGSELSIDDDDLVKSLQSIEIPIQKRNVDVSNEKVGIENKFNVNKGSVAKSKVNKPNNHKISNVNEDKVNKDETGTNIKPISDTIDKTESVTASNSSTTEKILTSPRKSTRISPKKHQLTKYYNLKSKRPRIIKQNPRNKIIIEHQNTNVNSQKTPEKKTNKKPGNVSKIKKAYLDLLQQNKIENNLSTNTENKTTHTETNRQANVKKTDKNPNIDLVENIKSKTLSHNNNHEINNTNKKNEINNMNNKKINEIPLILPKLTRIPQNLAVKSPNSIKSVTSDSTDVNSEMDTISDTNIQFIDEYDEKKEQLVTVYQIISKNETK